MHLQRADLREIEEKVSAAVRAAFTEIRPPVDADKLTIPIVIAIGGGATAVFVDAGGHFHEGK